MEGISNTLKILGMYYKKGWRHQQKLFSNKESEQKYPLKISLEFKKWEKRENTVKDPKTITKGYTWIQRDSNLISLRSLQRAI